MLFVETNLSNPYPCRAEKERLKAEKKRKKEQQRREREAAERIDTVEYLQFSDQDTYARMGDMALVASRSQSGREFQKVKDLDQMVGTERMDCSSFAVDSYQGRTLLFSFCARTVLIQCRLCFSKTMTTQKIPKR